MTLQKKLSTLPRDYTMAFGVIFFLLTTIQLVLLLASPLGLAPDEAYYWDWSRRLDLAYYSKGPLIAYLIYGSCWLFGDTVFAVRFPALVCVSLFTLAFFWGMRRYYGAQLAFWAAIAIRTMVMFMSQGAVMTTDAPAALFWLLALLCFFEALNNGALWRGWTLGLFFVGVGVLAKYTLGLLIPSVGLFLLLTSRLRKQLLSKQFLAGVLLFALTISPVVIWNIKHGWVNIQHNAGHLGSSKGFSLHLSYLLELVASQLGLYGPVASVVCIYALWVGFKAWRGGDERAGLLVWTSLPLVVLCVAVSLTRRVYGNWPMPFVISGLPLIVHLIKERAFLVHRVSVLYKWNLAFNALAMLCLFALSAGLTLGIPGKNLPSKRLVGWDELGQKAEEQLTLLREQSNTEPFVITSSYDYNAELSFYMPSRPLVLCAPVRWRRMTQYDIWGGWQAQRGKNALIVLKNRDAIKEIKPWFKRLEVVTPEPFQEVQYSGNKVREAFFFIGYGYNGRWQPIPKER